MFLILSLQAFARMPTMEKALDLIKSVRGKNVKRFKGGIIRFRILGCNLSMSPVSKYQTGFTETQILFGSRLLNLFSADYVVTSTEIS